MELFRADSRNRGCCARPAGCAVRSPQARCAKALAALAEACPPATPPPRPSRPGAWRIDAAERLERIGDRRPGEHGSGRRRPHPARPKLSTSTSRRRLVGFAHLADAVVGTVERRGRRDLDRRERAIVGRISPGSAPMMRSLPTAKPMRQARHRIGLRHRGELDGELHRAVDLQHRRRRVVVEIDLGIGQVGQR